MKKKKLITKLTLFFFVFFNSFFYYLFISPKTINAAGIFQRAYTTLTNSRFSFLGRISGTVPNNGKDIVIRSSGEYDNDTGNLFPGDSVCFNNETSNGCSNQTTYSVNNVINNTNFSISSGIAGGLLGGDRVVASQSARIAISFQMNTVSQLHHFRIYIPAASSNSGDGIPDPGKFDANTLDTNIANPGVISLSCNPSCNGGESLTSPTYSTTNINNQYYHVITANVSGTWNTTTTYTITLGHQSNVTDRFLNPAPSSTSHTRGVADRLNITIQSEDSSNTVIEKADTGVSPNDGVFVSAYVPLSVTWTITGVDAGQQKCGSISTSIATTATQVPFGTIYSADSFFDAAQTHTITTNAPGGYILQVKSDGDLKKDGSSPSIPSGSCDGSCNAVTAAAWNNPDNNGFGYTLSGTHAKFTITDGFKIFDSNNFQDIAEYNNTISNDTINVCYRLSVDGTQAAGLYWNKITYQAYPRF
jgi:hypothetical protein